MTPLDKQKALYLKAKDAYYNDPNGKTIMSDADFDALEDKIRKADPKWKGFKAGIQVKVKKTKAKLPVPMYSLDKVKPETVAAWLDAHRNEYIVISDKLDGSALELVAKDGVPFNAYTRGNGTIGGDVSYIVPHLRIPSKVGNKTIILRCEALFGTAAFQKYKSEFDAARNAASGVLNRQDIHRSIKDLSVVVIQVLEPNVQPSRALKWAKARGFNVVPHVRVHASKLSPQKLSTYLKKRKAKSKYALDGIVLTLDKVNTLPKSSNPSWAVAFKENISFDDAPIATIKRVLWEESSHGYLKPTVEYDPVKLDGVTLKFATAYNARYVVDNNLGPGAKVKILRSGDIIPKIVQVVRPASKPDLPSAKDFGAYSWNKSEVDFVLDSPIDNDNVRVKLITRFMSGVEIDYMKEGNVRRLYEAGFTNLTKIVRARPQDFLKVPGVKLPTAQKLHDAIHRVVDKGIPIVTLMDASGTFPRGLGSTRFEQLHNEFGLKKIIELAISNPDKARTSILSLNGWSSTTVDAFLKGAPKFVKWVKVTGIKPKLAKTVAPKASTSKLDGVNVTWTSYRNKEEEETVVDNGGTVVPFGSKTTVLLYRPGGKVSTKIGKAEDKGIPVMTYDQFAKKYKL